MGHDIATERLVLRPFRSTDVDRFCDLAGDWAVARMTSDIPHPLSRADAARWVKVMRGDERFAITRGGVLIGSVGYWRHREGVAELGFWLTPQAWGQGLATEAARALVARGFEADRLDAFTSSHFIDNPASARVIVKLGFVATGRTAVLSPSRGQEVETVTYRLERAAAAALGLAAPAAPAGRGWRRLVERVRG